MPSHSFTAAIVIVLFVIAVNAEEVANIRGPIANVIDESDYRWGPQDFSGLFYDINNDLGNELIRVYITKDNMLQEDKGITYRTDRQLEEFNFLEWNGYYSIGFLGEKYFAGYSKDSYLYKKSDCKSPLAEGIISKILDDRDDETQISYREPKMLKENYEITFYGIDENDRVFIILKKDGIQVDSGIVEPNKRDNATFIHKNDRDNGIVTLALHFKNCFRDGEDISKSKLTFDGIFQISDSIINLNEKSFSEMRLLFTTNDEIAMNLKKDIFLSKSKDFRIIENIWLKTADQDVLPTNPLRFYCYKKVQEAGSYEIRGHVLPVISSEITLNAESFPGLYYDLNNNIKTEEITLRISKDNQLEKAKGVEYRTHTQEVRFRFDDWGSFNVIGFMSNKYFSGYLDGSYFYNESIKNDSIMTNLIQNDYLSKVLIDSDNEILKESGQNITLMEGYKLFIKSIDLDGDKIYLVLFNKDDVAVDSKIVQPSKINATMADKTYYYKHNLKNSPRYLITIAIHFKNSYASELGNFTSIDGIWQISDNIESIHPERVYDLMKINEKTNNYITMINQGTITLTKSDQSLMGPLNIKTSNTGESPNGQKRFYLWKNITVDANGPDGAIDIIIQ